MNTFGGIWPALMTPATDNGEVGFAALDALIDYLIGKGVDGFYAGGTTGEGIYLPAEGRKQLIAATLKRVNGRVPTIVHVGAISIDEAIGLARHARDNGAAGISSVLPPLYESPESLRRYYTALAASVPDIPLTAYMLNPKIDGVALMRSLMDIPNLGGAKYTGPNMFELRQIIDLGGGKWTLFSGMDEQAIYGLMMGATGCVGSTLNFMPGVYQGIDKAVKEGRLQDAQDLQVRANRITAAMIEVGFPAALKAVVTDVLKIEMGQPRLPALPMTTAQRESLYKTLSDLGVAELVAM